MNVDLIVIFLHISNTTVTQKLLNERGQADIKRQLCSTCFSFVAFNVQIFSVLWYSWYSWLSSTGLLTTMNTANVFV